METLTTLSQEELQHLVAVSTKIPPSTNLEYVTNGLKEALAQEATNIEAALWWPTPEGFVPLTSGASDAFDAYVNSHEIEEVSLESNDFTAIEGGYRQGLVANRQTFGQLLLAGDSSREEFIRALSSVVASPLGLIALSLQLGEEVAKRTSTDKLTGLWNRQYFNERFRDECERLGRS